LGMCREETPNPFYFKVGTVGGLHYVIAVVHFCRCRLTGVGVPGPGKVAF